jgi:hypothetical protein
VRRERQLLRYRSNERNADGTRFPQHTEARVETRDQGEAIREAQRGLRRETCPHRNVENPHARRQPGSLESFLAVSEIRAERHDPIEPVVVGRGPIEEIVHELPTSIIGPMTAPAGTEPVVTFER